MTLSPKQKQALSGLAMGVASAAAMSVEQALTNPPFTLRSLLTAATVGAFAGLVHWLPTLGTKEVVEQKAQALAAEAVGKEAS